MTDRLQGRSGIFVIILLLFIMVVSVALRYVNVVSVTPGRVSSELNKVYNSVQNVRPLSLQKAEFLREWGAYRNSNECSRAVAASRNCPGDGFEGNVYVVTYFDSIEFPGFPTLRRDIRVSRRIGN